MNFVEEFLVPLNDIVIPVTVDWYGWVQITESANVSANWVGLFHDGTVRSDSEWQTSVHFFLSSKDPGW